MPAVAIVGAVAAVGVAASTGFAVVATIAAVGATVAAIGAVTKSKELMIGGAVIGAVGAIGGLASSAGMFGAGGIDGLFSGAGAVGEGAAAASAGLAADVSFVAPGAGETMAGIMQTAEMSGSLPGVYAGMEAVNAGSGFAPVFDVGQYGSIGDVIDIVNGVNVTPSVTPNVDPTAAQFETDFNNPLAAANRAQGLPAEGNPQIAPGSTGSGGDETLGLTPEAAPSAFRDPTTKAPDLLNHDPAEYGQVTNVDPGAKTVTGAPASSPASGAGASATGTPAPLPGQAAAGPPQNLWDLGVPGSFAAALAAAGKVGTIPVAGADSIWSKILDTMGKPGIGTLGYGVVQAAGSFLSGATSELTPAQIRALEAQAAQNTAATNLANQQAAMLQRQLANMSGGIPTGVRTSGLMNTPPKLAPVTGAPA